MKKKRNTLFAAGCVALVIMLTVSVYISLMVFGVVAENGTKASQGQGTAAGIFGSGSGQSADEGSSYGIITHDKAQQGGNSGTQGRGNVGAVNPGIVGGSQTQIGDGIKNDAEYYLNTNKTAKEVIDIYAEIMNNTKAVKPGYTKIEYQDLPGDAANRVVSEGSESIETVFGFIESLGLIVDEETAYKEPFVHQKGEEMSKFPVFDRAKGSYLTDPKGVKSYTYTVDSNSNVKLTFTLVDEQNPEPIGENSSVAPSYTGAVFSPMSKEKIDDTINHPIVKAFSKNIKYSLKYHDCKVVLVFNPKNGNIVSLDHYANINLSGSGDVVVGGLMTLEKQELVTVVKIKDFKY